MLGRCSNSYVVVFVCSFVAKIVVVRLFVVVFVCSFVAKIVLRFVHHHFLKFLFLFARRRRIRVEFAYVVNALLFIVHALLLCSSHERKKTSLVAMKSLFIATICVKNCGDRCVVKIQCF